MSSRQGYFNTTRLLLASGAQRDLADKDWILLKAFRVYGFRVLGFIGALGH